MTGSNLLTYYQDLSAASLAPGVLTVRDYQVLSDPSRDVSIGEVVELLRGESQNRVLTTAFNTSKRRERLIQSLGMFETSVSRWLRGETRVSTVKWIVPESLLLPSSNATFDKEVNKYEAVLADAGIGGAEARMLVDDISAPADGRWSGFLSIESVRLLSSITASDRNSLMFALRRGTRADTGLDAFPWSDKFPKLLTAVPLTWMYQYEPTPRFERLTTRLMRVGLSNVGHLTVLQDQSRSFVSETALAALVRVASAVRRWDGKRDLEPADTGSLLEDYVSIRTEQWSQLDIEDPSAVLAFVRNVVSLEGPVTADRLYRLASQSRGEGAFARKVVRSAVNKALHSAMGDLIVEEFSSLLTSWPHRVVRQPSHPRVRLRSLGDRFMTEVPFPEIAALVSSFRTEVMTTAEMIVEVKNRYGVRQFDSRDNDHIRAALTALVETVD